MSKTKVLIVGSGAREHAIAWSLQKSPHVHTILATPGNVGMQQDEVQCQYHIKADSLGEIVNLAKAQADLVVVGPENALALGLCDELAKHNIKHVGPSQQAAKLESSKSFAKQLCWQSNIATSKALICDNYQQALRNLQHITYPLAIKADGLASGKGVSIVSNRRAAQEVLSKLMQDRIYNEAGDIVLLEDYMEGIEFSFFALCDGNTVLPLGFARDYKRAYDHDEGANTGGMGAFSPISTLLEQRQNEIMTQIVKPLLSCMQSQSIHFQGILYCGLMLTVDKQIKVVEFNVRFGDPECQALLMRLSESLFPLLQATAEASLHKLSCKLSKYAATTVIMAGEDYPYAQKTIDISQRIPTNIPTNLKVFYGESWPQYSHNSPATYVSKGTRVFSVTAQANSVQDAAKNIYTFIDGIDKESLRYRQDIASE